MRAMSVRRWMVSMAAAAGLPLGAALAALDPPAEDPPAEQPAATEQEKAAPPEEPVPDLDDLLGLPKGKADPAEPRPKAPAELPRDPAAADLERKLSGEEVAEQFRQAVRLMNETSVRLQGARDTGVVTQRMQEDVLRKLDMLIKAAEQQRSRSRSSSSSSQQQQQQDQQSQPNQQQQSNQSGTGDNRSETEPPARRNGPLNDQIGGYGTTWGALPARVRDALMQGSSDRYSSLYQKMTESYYRRLAEEEQR